VPRFQVGLFGGTLKIKTRGWLQSYERNGEVPVRRIGNWYFVWMSNRNFVRFSMDGKHRRRMKRIYY